jgi:hypothetical protein
MDVSAGELMTGNADLDAETEALWTQTFNENTAQGASIETAALEADRAALAYLDVMRGALPRRTKGGSA